MKIVKLLTALVLVFSLILPSTVLAAESTAASSQESSVSLSGELNSKNNRVYQDYKKPKAYSLAGPEKLNKVYYIKKQATYKGVVYYLLSTKPSATTGVIGWTKAAAITLQSDAQEVPVDLVAEFNSKNNRIYSDYKKPTVYTLAGTAKVNQTFYVKKQATYNDQIYYLISTKPSATTGVIGWTKAAAVSIQQPAAKAEAATKEGSVDLLGKFNSKNNRIYQDYKKPAAYSLAGTAKLSQTFYIKKQATYNGVVYYLISTKPSATTGVIGWTKAAAVTTQVPVSNESVESSVNLLGHMRSVNNRIYADYKKPKAYKLAGTANTNEVFYIKKQAIYKDVVYYLISRNPSSTTGVVGWTKAAALTTQKLVTIDTASKTFYVKGTGSAYTKPWGGTKNYYFKSLVVSTDREFKVSLTEKVGSTVWYQGILNDKTVWIEAQHVTSTKPEEPEAPPVVKEESATNLVGKIGVSTSRIYADYTKQTAYTEAGSTNTDDLFYIKKQAKFNNAVYYLLSRNTSGTTELVGWVKSTDIETQTHAEVDKNAKAFYVSGAGSAYAKIWGGSKNIAIQDLAVLKGQLFSVQATEKVGTALWYKGTIDSKTVWIEASQLAVSYETETSLVGRIDNTSVRIYQAYEKQTSFTEAGTANTDKVFYIKKQAAFNNALYYQISESNSGTEAAGWVKSSDIATEKHTVIDQNAKTYYVKGTGSAYTDIWGGTKNISIQDMTSLKGSVFQVKATEKAGTSTWHQGVVSGKTVWVEASQLAPSLESPISLVGHINSTSVRIYTDYLKQSSYSEAGTANTNEVFYIKRKAAYNNATYYLISRNRSSTTGLVGWVKSTDIKTAAHESVDRVAKTYNIKGTGSAYLKIWGGTKNIVFQDLSSLKGAAFAINLTEKVGSEVWHRGVLSGKTVWIKESDLIKVETLYTQYNYTFDEALAKQMKILQQTDKYSKSKAYIASSSVSAIEETATVSTDGSKLRKSADFTNNISYTVNKGTKITIISTFTGEAYAGSTKWYKISYAGETLYAHSSIVNTSTITGTIAAKTNVVSAASATSHVYGTLAAGAKVTILSKGTGWHEISYGTWRNPTQSDVATYLEPSNNDKFQHLLLTSSAGVSAEELNKILVGKGILENLGQAFINGGKQYNVNEVYLISHALLETGQGTSQLANGVEVGKNATGTPVLVTTANRSSLTSIKKTYNMFGIGAVDGNALAAGAIKAYNSGWFTPEAAIIGGAQFVGTNYLDKGQNTLYKMRWNPASPATHQYASDIGWAAKQTVRMNSLYNMLDSYTITLDVPKYK
ncbi:N-acetylglucosaminidase [Planomicrobium sp. CPCC 101110]|uniref:N-acetylglucosaminidase n=1 Tax=Planomicrobium sp. CPCC 101110 TaxID=2599619 RepID=UPI0011B404E9|nr:N-acetylglucosaminidase [Planomicrobium sp. CPCC 101110]TWT27698.1 hypothetical protein FQV30_04060 [Planomicrobium sp. CPCC 101110]